MNNHRIKSIIGYVVGLYLKTILGDNFDIKVVEKEGNYEIKIVIKKELANLFFIKK